MITTLAILARYKDAAKQKFLALVGRSPTIPANVQVPSDPKEALRVGILIGRQEGYSEGLVDGTAMGLDVGLEAADAALSQPVIFGPVGMA